MEAVSAVFKAKSCTLFDFFTPDSDPLGTYLPHFAPTAHRREQSFSGAGCTDTLSATSETL